MPSDRRVTQTGGPATATPSIRMGEMAVGKAGEPLRTLLGSCVGLALFDFRNRVGGLAHIVLPDSAGVTETPGKYVNTAVPMLIERMEALAGMKLRLTARIAGGASMFPNPVAEKIGQQNVETCATILRQLRIPLAAQHCGGKQGRRMQLDTSSGRVEIQIIGQEPFEL